MNFLSTNSDLVHLAEHRKDAVNKMTNHYRSFLRLDRYQNEETREVIDDRINRLFPT